MKKRYIILIILLLIVGGCLYVACESSKYGTDEIEETYEDGTIIKTVTSKEKNNEGAVINKSIKTTDSSDGQTLEETVILTEYKDNSKKEEYITEIKNADGSINIYRESIFYATDGTKEQVEETICQNMDKSTSSEVRTYRWDEDNNLTIETITTISDADGVVDRTKSIVKQDAKGEILFEDK